MTILLQILSFFLLVCGVGYLVICRVLTKDLDYVDSSDHSIYRRNDLLSTRRRNLKFAALLFLSALVTCLVRSLISSGWDPGVFGLFFVTSDVALLLTAFVDLIENATYLHRYVSVRIAAGIGYTALFFWAVSLLLFFYMLPLWAEVLTLVVCFVLLVVYKKHKK